MREGERKTYEWRSDPWERVGNDEAQTEREHHSTEREPNEAHAGADLSKNNHVRIVAVNHASMVFFDHKCDILWSLCLNFRITINVILFIKICLP